MAGPDKSIKKRVLSISIIFTVLILSLLVRIAWLQFVDGEKYQRQVSGQLKKSQIISPERGIIYDRNGKALADNLSVETITADPLLIQKSKLSVEQIAQAVSEILQVDKADLLKKLQKSSGYEVIKRKAEKETGDKLKKWIDENNVDGFYIDDDTKRYYPDKNLAAQVIGFTGTDNQGLDGIEMEMEQYLKGKPGKVLNNVDAGGRELPFDEEKRIDVQNGSNVVLTIDETIQNIAERALEKAIEDYKVLQGGTAIVMDPRNGEILAMVSKPDFDLNDPFAFPAGVSGIESNNWKALKSEEKVKKLQETVWRNKALNITYEPGSTFKAITAAAGLEEGVISPDTEVVDAPVAVAGWTISCWKDGGHGRETFKEGVYNSCNPVFVKLSELLGIDRFYSYVRAFGFYEKTGIDLPGEASSIIHKRPTKIDMSTASFGQSFQITPIQLITAYGAIANGGKLFRPQLVKELTDSQGNVVLKYQPDLVRNVISKQTSDIMRVILEGVVSKGTGINAYVSGYAVAGKTGTSQTFENGIRSKERFIASFSAFAPADNPVICVLVVLDHPSLDSHAGGTVAAPVARRIIEETLSYLDVERKYTEKDKELMTHEVNTPDIRNKSIAEAEKLLSESGLVYKIVGTGHNNNSIVAEQSPKPYESLPAKSVVMLFTSKNEKEVKVRVPDVTNKNIYEATQTLLNAGLNIRVKGSGISIRQETEAGTEVEIGTVIDVDFVNKLPDD